MSILKVVNPFDRSVYFESPYAGWQEAEEAVSKARRAFVNWSRVPVAERVRLVREGLEYFNANRERVATDITKQMGKPITQSCNEISSMFERADYMCSIAEETLIPDGPVAKENFKLRKLRKR